MSLLNSLLGASPSPAVTPFDRDKYFGPPPTLTKGSLTLLSGGIGGSNLKTIRFMFNPNDIHDTKAVSYAKENVPGASHPVTQFTSGGPRAISFEIYLDGDRGRINYPNAGLDIRKEITEYRSLLYPLQYTSSFGAVFPPVVLFSFGDMYQGVPCTVDKADVKVNFWTPKLEPVRATISIVLNEITTNSMTYEDLTKEW